MHPVLLLFIIIGIPLVIIFAVGTYADGLWSFPSRKPKEQSAPHPTKYQTEPPTLTMEIHRGRHVAILKTRTDRTVVREEDMIPLSDELRKYHTTIATLNEVLEVSDTTAEETTQNEPPDPNARTALPERVDVDDYEEIPQIGVSAVDEDTHLREMMKAMDSYRPMGGYTDFLANSYRLMNPSAEDIRVQVEIMRMFPSMGYIQSKKITESFIGHCRNQGLDPMTEIMKGTI